jgi:hypothetical protein
VLRTKDKTIPIPFHFNHVILKKMVRPLAVTVFVAAVAITHGLVLHEDRLGNSTHWLVQFTAEIENPQTSSFRLVFVNFFVVVLFATCFLGSTEDLHFTGFTDMIKCVSLFKEINLIMIFWQPFLVNFEVFCDYFFYFLFYPIILIFSQISQTPQVSVYSRALSLSLSLSQQGLDKQSLRLVGEVVHWSHQGRCH